MQAYLLCQEASQQSCAKAIKLGSDEKMLSNLSGQTPRSKVYYLRPVARATNTSLWQKARGDLAKARFCIMFSFSDCDFKRSINRQTCVDIYRLNPSRLCCKDI
ncbi:hypothetical protein Lal_00048422 [Lupinus albus]|nr:hypothetical protein Lal_00048422 [Lupinus albus]